MKKLICSLLCLIFISTIALCDDPLYEKKLEYKRKKIEILVKTSYIGRENEYSTTDYYETIYTPEASATFKYGTSSTEKTGMRYTQEIMDWKIMRGGIRELSDVEFLELTGYSAKAAEIRKEIDGRNIWVWAGGILGIVGIGVMIGSASSGNSGAATAGAVTSLVGVLLSSFNSPRRHYIPSDFAQETADNYNISLKKSLGIPIETE